MAVYFVRKTGSNSNNGLSAGAAFLTIAKAETVVAAGDTVWIGAGVYREQVTLTASGSSGNVITFSADVDGAQTGDPGEVRWTAYDVSDTATPTGAAATLITGATAFRTFNGLTIVGGRASGSNVVNGTNGAEHDFAWNDCTIVGITSNAIQVTVNAGLAANWTFERCRLVSLNLGNAIKVTLTTHSADYNANVLLENCLVYGSPCVNIASTVGGSTTAFGGGIVLRNCTLTGTTGVQSTGTQLSTTTPCQVLDSLVACGTGIQAGASGQITEDYNVIVASTARSNVTAGTHSKSDNSYCPLLHLGQDAYLGRPAPPFFTPTNDSPLLGYGGSSPPSVDLLNRPRPAGGNSASVAVGCYERHDYATRDSGTVAPGSTYALKQTGPGDAEFSVPVAAVATVISIKVQRDGSYGGGTAPQLQLVANGEIGVAGQTVTDTGTASNWNTITLASFTPTAAGDVRLRLISAAGAGGNVFWDAAGVPAIDTSSFGTWRRGTAFPALVAQAVPAPPGGSLMGSP